MIDVEFKQSILIDFYGTEIFEGEEYYDINGVILSVENLYEYFEDFMYVAKGENL